MQGILYVRVSSQEQADEGYSLQAQEKEGLAYASRREIQIVKRWVVSESAKQVGRKAFDEMVEYAKTHPEVRAVLFEKPDRMCRNYHDYLKIDDLLHHHAKELHFFKAGLVIDRDSKASETLNLGIQVVLARHYVENLSEETRKGQKAKAEGGVFPGWAPIGYLNNTQTKTIELDPERAPKVQKLFRLAATGDYSVQRLVQIAMEMGLGARKRAGKLSKSHVHRLLQNPFYYGQFQLRGVVYTGKHPALISKGLFDATQEALRQRQKPRKMVHHFAFGGFLTCAQCGCAVVGEVKKGRYIYYHCTYKRGACTSPYIREEALIEQLGGVVKALEIPTDALEWMKLLLAKKRQGQEARRETQLHALLEREQKLRRYLDQLYEDRLEGKIPEAFWQTKSNAYQIELATVTDQLASAKHDTGEFPDYGVRTLELTQQLYPAYVRKSPYEKKELLKTLCSNCRLDGVTPVPTYRNPFDVIAEGVKTKDWGE